MVHGLYGKALPEIQRFFGWLELDGKSALLDIIFGILSMVDYHWQCKTHSNALKVQIDQRWWVIPAGHHSQ